MRIMTASAVGLLAVTLAACGSTEEKGDKVASAGRPTASQSQAADAKPASADDGKDPFLKYTQCMRDNGVDMPDPDANGGVVVDGSKVDRETFDAAEKACQKELPNGGEMQQMPAEYLNKLRAYSQCMRDHGLAKYPDPNPDGAIVTNTDDGLDPRTEEYQAAEKACRSKMPTMEELGAASGNGSFSGSAVDPNYKAGG